MSAATHHRHPFHRDADGHDLAQDHAWENVDPSGFYPDALLDEFPHARNLLSPQRQSHARPAPTGLRTLAMNAPAPAKTGRDGRAAGATSSQPSARSLSRAGTPHDEVTLGGGPSWGEPLAEPATSPSSLVAGREDLEDVSSARLSPGAA